MSSVIGVYSCAVDATQTVRVTPENVERCRVAAVELSEELRERVRARGVDPDGLDGFSFVGAHQRDPGRMGVRNHPAMGTEPRSSEPY